jgi:GH15 family glucan-1,4-alpha-glucosidase
MAQLGRFTLDIPRWEKLRGAIHEQVCRRGFNANLNSFVQYYGCKHLDASLLLMAQVGFLPADDARVIGTVKAIETHLMEDGFIGRYTQDPAVDGMPHGEGTFLPCSFWLADNYELQGRHKDAVRMFERLLDIRNDVGLLSEEYDPVAKRQLGNFPQAFSHVGLVNTAFNLTRQSSQPVVRMGEVVNHFESEGERRG